MEVVQHESLHEALSAVQADLSQKGVSKDGENKFDKYRYRSVDQLLNVLAPILGKHQVIIIPTITQRDVSTVTTQKGGSMYHCVLTVEYTLYWKDGSSITHTTMGEAMDRGDKSINKALTAAFKYFLFQCFAIPLEGDGDADDESHEMVVETISDEQLAIVLQLCTDTGTDPGDFMKWLTKGGEGRLHMMPATDYERAKSSLEKKAAKQYEADAKAEAGHPPADETVEELNHGKD